MTDTDELLAAAAGLRADLAAARANVAEPVEWYRYDILGNIGHLDALLTGEHRDLAQLAGGLPVADIGAADGDLGFALEKTFGWEVDIVDNSPTNQNGLLGAHLLRRELGSQARIADLDLDEQFRLPRSHYGLVFLLGILYHLQNPYYALRELARCAQYCVLSTKVARFAGPERTEIASLPVAYLVSPTETNNDSSNYWIFSAAGLDRLCERTGWEVLDRHHAGDLEQSNPSDPEHNERAFLLLRRGEPTYA